MRKRLFCAIKIKPSVDFIECYRYLRNELSVSNIAWIPNDNLHLTLKFLGEVDSCTIPDIVSLLQIVANRNICFRFSVCGVSHFLSGSVPSVIWFGIEHDTFLSKLFTDVDRSMTDLGFARERRLFSPHLTIGRVKYIHDNCVLNDFIEQFRGVCFQKVDVFEFILFESVLMSSGAVYVPIKNFDLQR